MIAQRASKCTITDTKQTVTLTIDSIICEFQSFVVTWLFIGCAECPDTMVNICIHKKAYLMVVFALSNQPTISIYYKHCYESSTAVVRLYMYVTSSFSQQSIALPFSGHCCRPCILQYFYSLFLNIFNTLRKGKVHKGFSKVSSLQDISR